MVGYLVPFMIYNFINKFHLKNITSFIMCVVFAISRKLYIKLSAHVELNSCCAKYFYSIVSVN